MDERGEEVIRSQEGGDIRYLEGIWIGEGGGVKQEGRE